jgi:hypothetical protein
LTSPRPKKPVGPGSSMPPMSPGSPSAGGDDLSGILWMYQVCSEVGFYQTHSLDQGHTVMSWLIDESYWSNVCQSWAGLAPAIDQTRASYFADINNGLVSNLFFVNGTLDPWSALSYAWQEQAPQGVTVSTVVGGSHCSDLSNLGPDSPPDVVAAHHTFRQLASQWLQ